MTREQQAAEIGERDMFRVLAYGLVPVVLAPLSWSVALRRLLNPPPAEASAVERATHVHFGGRILALVLLDTVIAVALLAAVAMAPRPTIEQAVRPSETPRIGAHLDAQWSGQGARVAGVWPDSPAQRGGLQSGDVVLTVDGTEIGDWKSFADEISAGQPGKPRGLRVDRDGATVELSVVPEVGLTAKDPERGLFEPTSNTSCDELWSGRLARDLWPLSVGSLAVLLLWLRARLRPPKAPQRWVWVVAPLLAAPLIGVVVAHYACVAAGGWSIGVVLVGLIAQGIALLGMGLVILRWLGPELTVVVGPRLSTGRASRLAVFYIAAALARALMALLALISFVPELQAAQDPGIGALFDGASGPLGRGLMFVAAVVVAPVAEEIIFRGVLLPGLARRMPPMWALVISAAMFALFHIPSHGVGAIMPGLLGLVFGWARLRTGKLIAPMLLHTANNLLVTVVSWGVLSWGAS